VLSSSTASIHSHAVSKVPPLLMALMNSASVMFQLRPRAVVGFLIDQTSCLRMAGMRLFAACDGGGGEDDDEKECWNLAKEHGSRVAGEWVRRVVEVEK
jgi:hypothetical protein